MIGQFGGAPEGGPALASRPAQITTRRRTACIERLDALVWPHALVFRAHGALVGVRATDARALDLVRAELPPDAEEVAVESLGDGLVDGLYSWVFADAGSGRRVHVVFEEFREVVRTTEQAEALAAVCGDLDFQVALHAPDRLFVHAGVVGWRGRAIVVPGRSFAGKSTLVAALVRAGATYYSDEFAVLDSEGRVHPYARALSMRDASGQPSGRIAAHSLGGAVGRAPLPLGLVLDTEYREGATWRARPVSAGQAVLKLLDNTVVARLRPEQAMATLSAAARGALAWRGPRGEAAPTAEAVLARAAEAFRVPNEDGAGADAADSGTEALR